MSFTTAVQADAWIPEIITYATTAITPIQTARVGETAPSDASLTMMPSPLSWRTR